MTPPANTGTWRARLAALVVTACGMAPASAAAAPPCAGADTVASDASVDELSDSVACLVNQERREAGLRRLDIAKRLWLAGWRHARDMRTNGYFSHRSRDGRSFDERIQDARYTEGRERNGWTLGETLVWANNARSAPRSLVRALMASPPHRKVILDDPYREMGVGLVRGTPTGNPEGVTVAIEYGSLVSPEAQRSDPPQ
jgi:uncharacterized protein YkwD